MTSLKEIGINGVIDVHSHSGGVDYFNLFTGSLPLVQSVDDLALKAELAGVSKVVTFPMPSISYYDYKVLISEGRKQVSGFQDFPYQNENESLLLSCRHTSNSKMFFPFMGIDPSTKQKEQLDFLSSLSKDKKNFGLKLHTLATGATALELKSSGFVDFAIAHNLPIMIHSGLNDPFSHPRNILELASDNPELRVCIAHLAWLDQEVISQVSKKDNLFIDTAPFLQICGCVKRSDIAVSRFNLVDSGDVVSSLLKYYSILKDNLVWGTDEPWTKCIGSDGKVFSNHTYFDEANLLADTFKVNPEAVFAITNKNTLRFLSG
jgi:hypothetical protein